MSESITWTTDPVCGMPVDPARGVSLECDGQRLLFCSDYCRERFLAKPTALRPVTAGAAPGGSARRIAYLSMEIEVDPRVPSYSGGLGVLAGDSLRACADLRIPIVAVSLLYRAGYFAQELDAEGGQHERPVAWRPEDLLRPRPETVDVAIEGRTVRVRAWEWIVRGLGGFEVPVFFLDTDLPQNTEWDRALTGSLYGGDAWYRLAQEVVLGIGGVRMLRALGFTAVRKIHLNEGHAALAAWELLRSADVAAGFEDVRRTCVFTTHTPVSAGHDRFPTAMVRRMLGPAEPYTVLEMLGGTNELDMTRLGLNLSGFVNGVAIRHQEVTAEMFPGYPIRQVTNGVHSRAWTCESFRELFDRNIPGWSGDPATLRHALAIPADEIWAAHLVAKQRLLALVRQRTGRSLDPQPLTIGFARRAAAYKRGDLVFTDIDRLRRIAAAAGPVQLVFAGKAHPNDAAGKEMIRRIVAYGRQLAGEIPVVYIPDYDVEVAAALVAGVDVWLNTPEPPLEASGTSGMKAAHNGVPSLGTLDGWWIEGHIEGVTGWAADGAVQLHDQLERAVLPAFRQRDAWCSIMKNCIALNASFFNTHRMVQQYATSAYLVG